MNPDRKIDIEIFNAALAVDSAAERKQYLDQACAGDAARRQRIDGLLEADANADSLFGSETRTLGWAGIKPLAEAPGTKIGPYKLLQQIGEGGMGVVYMAQQEEPVQRKVALKIVKVGMDTRQVVARFEAERQALAMMDHPNIAQVFDGGSTESGRPYFVMELVQGVPITEFCDKNKLSTRERIELFMPVCQAIQSAHQKGVIHRDIKPSNVLVTMHHGEPLAKVIDFGVAKATNQKLTEKTLFTNFGTMIGTPSYMSPEQAEMSSTDVDTRSDVYSLGVLLYELLTGSTPFDQKQLLSKGYGEMQRIIAEQEPEKPSLRMSTLAAEKRTALAKSRGLDAPALLQMLKGDLDCITMKCLEKDRRRRYDTPNELVADLKRHLNYEPVSAAPPSLRYRFQKFYGRKRALVHAVAAVGLTLILATVVSLWMAIRMNQLRREAVQAEKKALTQAAIAEAVNKFLNEDILKQANPWDEPDPDIKLRTVVDRAASAIEGKFKDQPLVEASIRRTLSAIYSGLDDQEAAKHHNKRAREIFERELGREHPDTLKALLRAATDLMLESDIEKSKFDEAYTMASEVLATARRAHGSEHEISLEALRKVVIALGQASRYQEQRPVLDEAIALHEKALGKNDDATIDLLLASSWNHISGSSQLEKAVQVAREALQRSETLRPDHPRRFQARESLSLAIGYFTQDKTEKRRLAQENLDFARRVFGPQHQKTIRALENRALAAESPQESLNLISECYQLALKRWSPGHRSVLQVQRYLAEALAANGDRRKAEDMFLSGLETLKTNFTRRERLLTDYLWQLGQFYFSENPDKAESYFKETADIALETQGEQSVHYQFGLIGLANLYARRSEWRPKAIEVDRKLLKIRMESLGIRNRRTTLVISVLAENLAEEGKAGEADEWVHQAAANFSQAPPQSDEEWSSVRNIIQAINLSPNKERLLDMVRGSLSHPPKNTRALTAVAEFHRVAGESQACHKACQVLTREFPDVHWHWYAQSATALEAGDVEDHLACSREMLKRFGNEENDIGILDRVLKTFCLVPGRWTPGELASLQRVYARLNHLAGQQPQKAQVFNRAALALADYRLGRLESALENLDKVLGSNPELKGIAWAQALAVAALCHAALGNTEKAMEALSASEKALKAASPSVALDDVSRRNCLSREARQLLQGKTQSQLPTDVTFK